MMAASNKVAITTLSVSLFAMLLVLRILPSPYNWISAIAIIGPLIASAYATVKPYTDLPANHQIGYR